MLTILQSHAVDKDFLQIL